MNTNDPIPRWGRFTSRVIRNWLYVLLCLPLAGSAAEIEPRTLAQRLFHDAEFHGGLIVHLGCGDGRLTAALGAASNSVVQGLEIDAAKVDPARQYIRSLGCYGRVSVTPWLGPRLPYAENLVNLLVVEASAPPVPDAELLRVLVPRGAAVFLDQNHALKSRQLVKPWPDKIDEWTHYLHDASGNPVAHDDAIAPPGRLQWTAGPLHSRSHEFTPSLDALVSARGRLFYIVDQAPIGSLRARPQWEVVARDAFNGIELWRRSIQEWFPYLVNWGRVPPQLQRKLVAVNDRVYVTLGLHAPVSVLDAATGRTIRVLPDTQGAEEILWHRGILLLAKREVTPEKRDELKQWRRLVTQDKSPVYQRETAEPFVNRLRQTEAQGAKSLLAVDPQSGRVLWSQRGPDVSGLRPGAFCAAGRRVFYQNGGRVMCVDLKTGKAQWTAKAGGLRLANENYVLCAARQALTALSAATGQVLWQQKPALTNIRDLFLIAGHVWVGGFKPAPGKRSPAWGPYCVTQRDLPTGRLIREIEPPNPGHHHRCYQNKATERYLLGGRRGTEFINLQTGEVRWNSWARGVCRYGVMPANGLLYVPPNACACYIAAKILGFNALAARAPSAAPSHLPAEPSLVRGPAYGTIPNPMPGTQADADWPTYRADAQRSGNAPTAVGPRLRRLWQVELGNRLTPPTIADGKVFVASVEDHRVLALDAATGEQQWSFTAGARVDSPPSVADGVALFGCRDGQVYALRTSDGALLWRLQAAPEERRVLIEGQLESVAPAHGSVLLQGGVAYVTAGRNSYLDQGIVLDRLAPRTGKLLSRSVIYSPDPQTGRQPPQTAPSAMPGERADLLSADNEFVYLRDMVLDAQGRAQSTGHPHLFALTDFLDDTWAHRSYWIFGHQCSIACGCAGRARDLIYGRLLVFNDRTIYGYGRATVHWSNAFEDGPYRLFALKRANHDVRWTQNVPITPRAMVLTKNALFVAGTTLEKRRFGAPIPAHENASLLAISTDDGSLLADYPLSGKPAFDGLAAAGGRLYVALAAGRLAAFEGRRPASR